MKRIACTVMFVLGVLSLAFAVESVAGEFEMIRWTIDGGGMVQAAGGNFELSGTAGQPDAGVVASGGEFALTSGFWFRQAEGDCNCDSAVNLFDFGAFTDCLTGPGGGLIEPGCICFDLDRDEDVDLDDFLAFQFAFTGG